jgi:nucleoside triphosphate diphosphatase
VTPSQPTPDPPPDAPSPHPSEPSTAATLDRALALVRFLRAHCEWDAAQTPDSLLPYLLEEAHETAEAVVARDDIELRGELGDLLLNIAFQIVLAEERQAFVADDVVTQLEAKMRRRHPHLYGDGPQQDWETLKAQERAAQDAEAGAETRSLLHGVAGGLEPLSRAQRMQDRVAAVGFDWPNAQGAFDKVVEEVGEVRELLHDGTAARVEEEIGDLLFAVVNLARLSGSHAMRALQKANAKFESRFRELEVLAIERGVVLGEASLEELDVLWDEVKARAKQ